MVAQARYPELCNALLPVRSGSPGCYWQGQDRSRPCRLSPHRGCTAVCNAPYSHARVEPGGLSSDDMMCKIARIDIAEQNFSSDKIRGNFKKKILMKSPITVIIRFCKSGKIFATWRCFTILDIGKPFFIEMNHGGDISRP